MKLKTIICLTLAVILAVSCLTGCRGIEDPVPASDPAGTKEPQVKPEEPVPAVPLSAVINAKALGFSAFDNQLVEYLKQAGRADENFTVSPLSFKAALTMAALGAEGETQAQLLEALGFKNLDELRAWYATVLAGVDGFKEYFEAMEKEAAEYASFFPGASEGQKITSAYWVVNSVWSNQDLPGEFRQSFLDDIAKTCYAEAYSAKAAELADAVNAWVNEKTNGLIPSILNDASETSAVLVNALYLKTGWDGGFYKLGDRDFTTRSGEKVQKPFMEQTSHMAYYKDDQTQLVSVPLQGGMSMVFVLGEDTGLAEKLAKAEYKLVDVTVPMFDVETSLDQKELVNYLKLMGCDRMFTDGAAEFDPLYTDSLYVEDIIQKAKVHIDEEGLEAAAVTAIIMVAESAEPGEPETPEIFLADQPFSFYILKNGESPELLFWGQIVN
jgi:serpin B